MFSSVIWVCRNSTTYLRGLLRTKYESAFPVQCLNRFWFYYQCLCPDPPNQAFSKGFTQPSQSYQLRQAFVREGSRYPNGCLQDRATGGPPLAAPNGLAHCPLSCWSQGRLATGKWVETSKTTLQFQNQGVL